MADGEVVTAGLDARISEVARGIHAAGGWAVVVGGFVRDRLLGVSSKDVDVEVFGLTGDALANVLSQSGTVLRVGESFPVFKLAGVEADFSLPRGRPSPGEPTADSFAEAARHRDLTINSVGLDPLTGELLDPHGGQRDIDAGILRATDSRYFGEDPLRAFRVAQLASRFGFRADRELVRLCRALDLDGLAPERIFEELRKALIRGQRPSVAFELLRETRALRVLPELEALVGVPQDPEWHPEGDVWTHTLMVVDEAARLRDGGEDDLALMMSALCHDLGKPATTSTESGRIRSLGHERQSALDAESLLSRLRASSALTSQVKALVARHLAPAQLVEGNAGDRAYRRLSRQLSEAGTSMRVLERLARADHLGRTTADALARTFPAGDVFRERVAHLAIEAEAPTDVVLGRHLIARGLQPGEHFHEILARCRDLQYETGWVDPDRILDSVLGPRRG
jgi:tRNA nucleotidyltransferase (CCA-adding enzyme)